MNDLDNQLGADAGVRVDHLADGCSVTTRLCIEEIALVEVTKVSTQQGLVLAQADVENQSVPTAFKKDLAP